MDEPVEAIYDDAAADGPAESDGEGESMALMPLAGPASEAPAVPAVVDALRPRRLSRDEIEALKGTLKAANKEMTDAQFTVFLAAAQALGLNPLARQVVPIFQSGRMTVQTTIDGFRLIAERTRKYRGQIGPFWCGKDGKWQDVWLADDAPVAAKVGVKRSDFDEPMWGVARLKSYHKDTPTWRALPDVMIAKVAESLALRKAFPAELSGAYTDDELMIVDADPLPVATTTQQPHQQSHQQPQKPTPVRPTKSAASTTQPMSASEPTTEDDLPTWEQLGQAAKDLGLSRGEWVQTVNAMVKNPAKLTNDDRRTMADWIKQRRAQFEATAERTPPLESLAFAGA